MKNDKAKEQEKKQDQELLALFKSLGIEKF